jgi:hypothetical protein
MFYQCIDDYLNLAEFANNYLSDAQHFSPLLVLVQVAMKTNALRACSIIYVLYSF